MATVTNEVFLFVAILTIFYLLIIRNKYLQRTSIGKVMVGIFTWAVLSIPFILLEGDYQIIAFLSSAIGLFYMIIKIGQASTKSNIV